MMVPCDFCEVAKDVPKPAFIRLLRAIRGPFQIPLPIELAESQAFALPDARQQFL